MVVAPPPAAVVTTVVESALLSLPRLLSIATLNLVSELELKAALEPIPFTTTLLEDALALDALAAAAEAAATCAVVAEV